MAAWETRLLRATSFIPRDAGLQPHRWWGAVRGTEPRETLTQAHEKRTVIGAEELGGNLVLQTAPSRVDWVLRATENPEEDIDTLGQFAAVLPGFQEAMKPWWTRTDPPILRIAFGAVLERKVHSLKNGYETLAELLPAVSVDPEGSTDLEYRINRPRQSKIRRGLVLNRLSKWMVVRRRSVAFEVTSTGDVEPSGSPLYFLAQCELDINTPAENEEPFEPDERWQLFEELVRIGIEIAERGDIA